MNPRIKEWLKQTRTHTPVMVIDLEEVRKKYHQLKKALKHTHLHYAVKANPEFDVLRLLAREGAGFDIASPMELDAVLLTGVDPEKISYGHTIKKSSDIAYAWQRGVRLFAFDCLEELEKIAKNAPHSQVYCRLWVPNEGARWPLSRKFGCRGSQARDLLLHAKELELDPVGISFHVGSQQTDPAAYARALDYVASVYNDLKYEGLQLKMLNIGGGFPGSYDEEVPSDVEYGEMIFAAIEEHFGDEIQHIIAEPGRSLVADAGVLASEVILVSHKDGFGAPRWVYLDVGYYSGLIDVQDEAITYCLETDYPKNEDEETQCILAGPTCDSVDMIYERTQIYLPDNLKEGDMVYFMAAGAYTVSCAAKSFNGMEGPRAVCLPVEEDMPLFSKKIVNISDARENRKKSLWG
ncbi:MAG: type III PLP-dependent enzyme [Alphaproteobacteria bacterium]